jgi:hypothetical protein
MAKKVVFEVEDYTKVLNFVAGRKLRSPGAIEAYGILNAATLMDITVLPDPPEKAPSIEQPLIEEEEEVIASFTPSAE